MKAIVDFCLIPIGVGVSLSPYIAECQKILSQAGLHYRLHAYGTNIEGEWDAVFAAVKACHEQVHQLGAPRVSSTIKVGTRIDRDQSMDEKIDSVNEKLKTD